MDEVLVVSDGSTLAIDNAAVNVVSEDVETTVLSVGYAGARGPQGLQGANGNGATTYRFSWGDATPAVIATAGAGTSVYCVQIAIQTPFNGTGAAISIGDAGDHERLFAATQLDPGSAATYETFPAYRYAAGTEINIYITPGSGASAGSGAVIIYLET